MYVSQGEILIFVGDSYWVVEMCLDPGLPSRSDQQLRASAYPYQNLTANILTTKYSGSFILASLTNVNHPGEFKKTSQLVFFWMCVR